MPHLWNTVLPTTTRASCTALCVTELFAKPYLSMENIATLYYSSFSTLFSFKNIIHYWWGGSWFYHHWNGTKFNLQHQRCATDCVLRNCGNLAVPGIAVTVVWRKRITEFKYRMFYLGGVEDSKPPASVSSFSPTFFFRNHLNFNFRGNTKVRPVRGWAMT